MQKSPAILLVDPDETNASEILRFLKASNSGYIISHTTSLSQSLSYINQHNPDLLLINDSVLGLPDYPQIKSELNTHRIPSILIVTSDDGLQNKMEQAGATESLVKNKINLLHLDKAIANTLKLAKATSVADSEKTGNAHLANSYQQILETLNDGVLVINRAQEICAANKAAYRFLSEQTLKNQLSDYLRFRENASGETLELPVSETEKILLKATMTEWMENPANLIVLSKVQCYPNSFLSTAATELLSNILNSVSERVLLVKDERILLANQEALKTLGRDFISIQNSLLNSILVSEVPKVATRSIRFFFEQKEEKGKLVLPDNSELRVKFITRPVALNEGYYNLISFTPQEFAGAESLPQNPADKINLEGVLHLASHDLREPVRTILNYVDLITRNIDKGNYTEAIEFASIAKTTAVGMDKMLSDLKTFTGLDQIQPAIQKTNLHQVLQDVIKQLKPEIEAAKAEVSFADLPDVAADRHLVEKLLYQLIDNALKFRRKEKLPVIDIGFDKFEGRTIFCVRDNGIGVSKKYYLRIFEPFERLNRSGEYSGNGLGLAICKKIVEMHNGEIWVESLPGSGSNFYFTLQGE